MGSYEVLLRLVQKEARGPFLVAIDGRCASGKTTLAGKLRSVLECIIEGSYSCHPKLRENYDLCVFVDISPDIQKIRLMERNPSAFEAFQTVWVPREEHYFDACQVRSHCDLVIWGG